MNRRRGLLILGIAALLILFVGGMLFYNSKQPQHTETFNLTVHVVNLDDKSPVTNIWVDALSSNGSLVDEQSPDERGDVTFLLPPGKYIIQIAAGYTGRKEIDLNSDQSVELEVLPVLR